MDYINNVYILIVYAFKKVAINAKILNTNCHDVKPLTTAYEMPNGQGFNSKHFICGCNIDGFNQYFTWSFDFKLQWLICFL
jgi:hypothetical protein